MDIWYSSND